MGLKYISFLVACLLSFNLTAGVKVKDEKVVTPARANKVVAKYQVSTGLFSSDDKILTEYDVFGPYDMDGVEKKMSISKRKEQIEKIVLRKLLGIEANNNNNIAKFKRFDDVKNESIKRNAAMIFHREEIGNKYVTKSDIENYFEKNRDIFLKSFDDEKERIYSILIRDHSNKVADETDKLLEDLKSKYKVYYNKNLIKRISGFAKVKGGFFFADSLLTLNENTVLVSYKNTKSTISDIIKAISGVEPMKFKLFANTKMIETLIEGKILNEILSEEAEKRGYFENEDVQELVTRDMDNFNSYEYMKLISTPADKVTKDELVDYYVAHQNDKSLFSTKKMRIIEIFKPFDNYDDNPENDKLKVALELENILSKIKNGDDFKQYARFINRPSSLNGDLGYIYPNELSKVGSTANEMKAGDISQLIYQPRAISIIYVQEVMEPKLHKFDNIEHILTERVKKERRKNKLDKIKKELFEKYDVTIL